MPPVHHSLASFRHFPTALTIAALALLTLALLTTRLRAHSAGPSEESVSFAATSTIVNTDITTDTTWTIAGSPYEVTTDIQVYPVATLTIEPGVVVQFAQLTSINVLGKMLATGTPTQTILFTGSTAQPGWWDGISFTAPSLVTNTGSHLEHVTIEYGGYLHANLHFFRAQAEINHVNLRYSSKAGLYTQQSEGIELKNTAITNNGDNAIYLYDFSGQSRYINVTATGNGTNAIVMRSALIESPYTVENVGLPYHVTESMSVNPGGAVTIEPGVEMNFNTGVTLDMRGILRAVGTAKEPILLTGIEKIRGGWNGILIQGLGAAPNHGSVLEYVTLEYGGGADANLRLLHASARINHSTIRQSAKDGVRVDIGASATWIDSSAIVQNSGFGVRNTDLFQPVVVAAGNWWGSATGPTVAGNCNEGGTGSMVSSNVEFVPFLTEANEQPSPVAPLDLHQISIAPQQWYVPADNVTQVEVILTLRTGEGNPIAGQEVFLHSTLGEVLSGAITNAHGQTRARVKSDVAGDAILTASVTRDLPCSSDYRSASSTIHFMPFAQLPHMPEAEAPYMNGKLSLGKLPLVKDVPTFLSARMVNPGSAPIYVNGSFGIAQFGIGLQFAPVGSVQGVKIEPGETKIVGVEWTPPIVGYYCIIFTYTFTNQSGTVESAEAMAGGSAQQNANVQGSAPTSRGEAEILTKARNSMELVNQVSGLQSDWFDLDLPGRMIDAMTNMLLEKAQIADDALNGYEPQAPQNLQQQTSMLAMAQGPLDTLLVNAPRQDWNVITPAQLIEPLPLVPDPKRSAAMSDALHLFNQKLAMANAHAIAAVIAKDRYAGAAAAQEMQWASIQLQAMGADKMKMGQYLLEAADAMEAYKAAWIAHGLPDLQVTRAQIVEYQVRLQNQGFDAAELAAAERAGLSAAEVETARQRLIAADPAATYPSAFAAFELIVEVFRELGGSILYPSVFGGPIRGSGLLAADQVPVGGLPLGNQELPPVPVTNNLARVYEMTTTVTLGNPKPTEATIDLRLLPVDLPAGWTADVTPDRVRLASGEETTVVVLLTPQGPSVQGTSARVAVEGFIGNELLGGVVAELLVPYNVAKPDAHLTTFLPMVGH